MVWIGGGVAIFSAYQFFAAFRKPAHDPNFPNGEQTADLAPAFYGVLFIVAVLVACNS